MAARSDASSTVRHPDHRDDGPCQVSASRPTSLRTELRSEVRRREDPQPTKHEAPSELMHHRRERDTEEELAPCLDVVPPRRFDSPPTAKQDGRHVPPFEESAGSATMSEAVPDVPQAVPKVFTAVPDVPNATCLLLCQTCQMLRRRAKFCAKRACCCARRDKCCVMRARCCAIRAKCCARRA